MIDLAPLIAVNTTLLVVCIASILALNGRMKDNGAAIRQLEEEQLDFLSKVSVQAEEKDNG